MSFEEALTEIKGLPRKFEKRAKAYMNSFGGVVAIDVKRNLWGMTPVHARVTGDLGRSIVSIPHGHYRKFSVRIGSNLPYARVVHEGDGRAFPKPYLKYTWDRNRTKYKKMIENEFLKPFVARAKQLGF